MIDNKSREEKFEIKAPILIFVILMQVSERRLIVKFGLNCF